MSLYKSASGREVNHASSSSLDTFRLCRRKFKLGRIDGWRQKEKKASREFGKCIESAVQFYHENGLKDGDAVSEFQRLWAKFIDQKDLTYTDQEQNWLSLNTMGKEMARLYEILLPTLPIKNPKWQLQFLKKLWPGTNLADLQFMAYVDLLSTLEDGSRIIVDIKTAKSELPITSNMMSLDGQLRKYAWVSGIRDVAFLNFVKAKPEDFKKGTSVTLLESVGERKAGQQLTVFKFMEAPAADPMVGPKLVVGTTESVQLMDKATDEIKGKGSTEAKAQLFADYLSAGKFTIIDREKATKCRLQFVRGTIPEEELAEIGQQIGVDMFSMKAAHDTNFYSKDGGLRFPNATCSWCEFLPLCNPDPKKAEETLVRIGPKAPEKDWLDELEGDEE